MRPKVNLWVAAICLALSAGFLSVWRAATPPPVTTVSLSPAICPVVYPLDESSSARGYHYIFYGNAFFIDRDGYLVTAAHVLSDFRDGGQPHILLRLAEAPPRLLKVVVVATDPQHDIAVLRAKPNPFEGKYQVAFLPLATNRLQPGGEVVATAVRPSRMKDPHTFDAPREEQSSARIVQYVSTQLDNGQAKTELFLFSHEVERGQSGAPVLSRDTREVVGFVEGQWLHPDAAATRGAAGNWPSMPGAAVPIVYVLPLLEQNHIVWQSASAAPAPH